jgi:uncharacterized protein (TIGR03546 family)
MLWIKLLKSIINLLHSDVSPRQIAGGVALGSLIGFTPFFSLNTLFVIFLILIINVNIGAAILAVGLFSIIAFFIDPLAHVVGYFLLVQVPSLHPFWTALYNMPLVPFTRFNNTVMLGSIVIALLLFLPIYALCARLIVLYREKYRSTVDGWKIMKFLKMTSVYSLYDKYR